MLPVLDERQYICPGQTRPISRAVHLARLAAYYPACRRCPYRDDGGHLSPSSPVDAPLREWTPPSLFGSEGVRGVCLNELTRRNAGEIAAAFAQTVWDAQPFVVRPNAAARQSRPTLAAARDHRASSPELFLSVVATLRRMGCHVTDIGVATPACFRFAVHHLRTDGGVMVTGAGRPPGWNGLDFVGADAIALTARHGLPEVESRCDPPPSRPTRIGGDGRFFDAFIPYTAGLLKHLQDVPPVKLVSGCASPAVERVLRETIDGTACRRTGVALPDRIRNLADDEDVDVQRVATAVQSHRADAGVLIDEDCARCRFFDASGKPLAIGDAAASIQRILSPSATAALVGEDDDRDATPLAIPHRMAEINAACGFDRQGRHYFNDGFPSADAVVALAYWLRSTSGNQGQVSKAGQTATIE